MSVGHYENFPVASILLPHALRRAVVDIYRFARSADDLADEGRATPDERIAALEAYRAALHTLGAQQPNAVPQPPDIARVFAPLARTVKRHQLPLTPFLDLISAFEQDVRTHRYPDYRFGVSEPDAIAQSDAICTALQLINILQDVGSDVRRGRIYLPQAELVAHDVTEDMIVRGEVSVAWRALMAFQIGRCRALLGAGAPLGRRLPGRSGLEVRLVIEGGRAVLNRIEAAGCDVFAGRLVLRTRDWPGILWRALTT